MEKYLDVLKRCQLFDGIGGSDLETLIRCLSATVRHYDKNSYVFMSGDAVTAIGIVVSGSVHVIQEDFWGNRAILANIGEGGLFGEAFSCSEAERLPVGVLASRPCDILLVDSRRIVTTCSSACSYHTGLIRNMLGILAGKNIALTRKIGIVAQRGTRAKLLAYLSEQSRQAGSAEFCIPFNRQELAEYLSVDRSAMSNELSKMRRDGIVSFQRSRFKLLKHID